MQCQVWKWRELRALVVGNNDRDGFGRFLTRKRSISLELLIISSVSLSPAEILGSDCQGLVEREDGVMEVLMCCGGVERNGEKEREMNILILQKGEKQERAGL